MSKRASKKGRVRNERSLSRIGARVKIRIGAKDFTATVIEDRGNIGVGGQHLVRVRTSMGLGREVVEIEIPVEELRAA